MKKLFTASRSYLYKEIMTNSIKTDGRAYLLIKIITNIPTHYFIIFFLTQEFIKDIYIFGRYL